MTDERNAIMLALDFSTAYWRKSSRSTANANCVEVAFSGSAVGIRDSKNIDGSPLAFPACTWHTFLHAAERG